jgi:protein O-mannosyl-transferase
MAFGPLSAAARAIRPNALWLVAACAVVAVEAQVVRNDLVWDDSYLVEELDAGGGPVRLAEVVASPFWDNSSYLVDTAARFWRPLTSAVLWAGATAFDKSPAGMHILSLLAALAAAAALARLASRALAGAGGGGARLAPWVGVVFLAHPLCAEVLCLVSNLSDHLALAFAALEVALLVDGLVAGSLGSLRLAAASLLGFLACASKELGVVTALAPLAAFLVARAVRPELARRALASPRLWAAAFIPVAAYLALRTAVLQRAYGSGAFSFDLGSMASAAALGFGQVGLRAVVPAPAGGLLQLSWRDPLALFAAIAAWGTAGAVVIRDLARGRRLGLASTGVLVAAVLFAPSLAAIGPSSAGTPLPTRYLHLPLAGLLLAALPALARRWRPRLEAALLTGTALLLLLGFVRIGEWRTAVSFYGAELRHAPASEVNRVNLAQALCDADRFDEAAAALDPLGAPGERFSSPLVAATYWNARAKVAMLRDGDPEAASRALVRGLEALPSDLANVLLLAEARQRAGRPDEALTVLRKALASPWFHDRRRAALERYEASCARRAADGRRGPQIDSPMANSKPVSTP